MKNHCLLGALALVLVACGGGGSGGGGSNGGSTPSLVENQSFSLAEDSPFTGTIQIHPKNGAGARVEQVSQPQNGTVSGFASTGTFSYQPNQDVFGTDSFVVRVTEDTGASATATITLKIAAVNDSPVASSKIFEFPKGAQPSFDALATAADADRDPLTVELDAPAPGDEPNPEVGSAQVSGGTILLSLPQDFVGVSRVKYSVKDPQGASGHGTAVIYVGMHPLEIWYARGSYDGDRNVYANDLTTERKVSSFIAPTRAANVQFSADTKVALIEEFTAGRVAALWTVSTQSSDTPQLLTQPLAPDEHISKHTVNGDGSWVAYIVENAVGVTQFWIAPRAAPEQRRELKLPDSYSYWEQEQVTSPMTFNAAGSALYFVARSSNSGSQYLYRVDAASGNPVAVVPNDNGFGVVTYFAVAPDDSYLVVQAALTSGSGIFRIPTSALSQRTQLSPPEPTGIVIADAALTRIAYVSYGFLTEYTDDRLLVANVSDQQNWTEYVAADATRTGPFTPLVISPVNGHVLVQDWSKSGNSFQIDLSEATGNGKFLPISPPPPAGDTSQSRGRYAGDSIVYSYASNLAPWRLIQAPDATPTVAEDLFAPGAFLDPVFSLNTAVVGLTHTRNIESSPYTEVRLANRAAPGQMIGVTSGRSSITDILLLGIVEMP